MEYAHKKYLQETGKSPYSGEEYDGDKLYTTEYMEWLEKTAMEGFSLPIHNVVGSNICKSCGIDLSKEECINCQMGFG